TFVTLVFLALRSSAPDAIEFPDFNEIVAPVTLADEEISLERGGSQSDRMSSLSMQNPDILSVNKLLELVLETVRQVA
ncbi:hypothetical protein S83_055554, partial [Arachis hypogaea]